MHVGIPWDCERAAIGNFPVTRLGTNMKIRRRDFGWLATVGVWPSAVQGARGNRAPIPIAFAGVSYSHGRDKLRLVMDSPDWKLVGVCDSTEPGRRVAEGLGARLIDWAQLGNLADVVVVESEIQDHAADALRALEMGKHVHLEKPPATRLEDMQRIVELARRQHRLVQTGFMWRQNPGVQQLIRAVRDGLLGEVILVRAFMGNNLAVDRRPDWAQFPGGSMFEQGSHLVDIVVRMLGKPNRVTPFLRMHGTRADPLRDNNVAVLEFERATAVITNTALQAASTPPRSVEVIATKGTALLQPIEPPTLQFDMAVAAGPFHKGPQDIPMPPYRRYEAEFAELAAAVRGESPLAVSLDDELLVAETVLRAAGML